MDVIGRTICSCFRSCFITYCPLDDRSQICHCSLCSTCSHFIHLLISKLAEWCAFARKVVRETVTLMFERMTFKIPKVLFEHIWSHGDLGLWPSSWPWPVTLACDLLTSKSNQFIFVIPAPKFWIWWNSNNWFVRYRVHILIVYDRGHADIRIARKQSGFSG